MRTVRQFFERIIEWDWPDAPSRNPVIAWDIPKKPEPLPKFLDDRDAARLMTAARAAADPRDRLVLALLARTAMRAGELANLEPDAVVLIGSAHSRQRPDRRVLRAAARAARRLRERRHGPPAPRSQCPHARQRTVHQARRALRTDLTRFQFLLGGNEQPTFDWSAPSGIADGLSDSALSR